MNYSTSAIFCVYRGKNKKPITNIKIKKENANYKLALELCKFIMLLT